MSKRAGGLTNTLTGGFWPALSSHPQPAMPILKIKHLGDGKALVSWPMDVNGFALEYTTHLGSGIWLPENNSDVDTPTEHTVTVTTIPAFRAVQLRSL